MTIPQGTKVSYTQVLSSYQNKRGGVGYVNRHNTCNAGLVYLNITPEITKTICPCVCVYLDDITILVSEGQQYEFEFIKGFTTTIIGNSSTLILSSSGSNILESSA